MLFSRVDFLFHSKFEIINSDKFDRTRTWGKNRAIAHLSFTITVEAAKIEGQSQRPAKVKGQS
jgi:hypothetical protein